MVDSDAAAFVVGAAAIAVPVVATAAGLLEKEFPAYLSSLETAAVMAVLALACGCCWCCCRRSRFLFLAMVLRESESESSLKWVMS